MKKCVNCGRTAWNNTYCINCGHPGKVSQKGRPKVTNKDMGEIRDDKTVQ